LTDNAPDRELFDVEGAYPVKTLKKVEVDELIDERRHKRKSELGNDRKAVLSRAFLLSCCRNVWSQSWNAIAFANSCVCRGMIKKRKTYQEQQTI
jgi:hypothetical protein